MIAYSAFDSQHLFATYTLNSHRNARVDLVFHTLLLHLVMADCNMSCVVVHLRLDLPHFKTWAGPGDISTNPVPNKLRCCVKCS